MIARLARKARAALDVVTAALAVTRARRMVANRPVGALVERAEIPAVAPDARALSPQDRCRSARWGTAVDRALRWVPGDSACLIRATALRGLLTADGVSRAVVRIGVRRGAAGFEAHAWVELDGTPLAEPKALSGAFSSLDGVTLR